MKPTFYANKIDATPGEYEIVLDCLFPGSEGCRLVLAYPVAMKLLGLLQATIKEAEPVTEAHRKPRIINQTTYRCVPNVSPDDVTKRTAETTD